MQTYQLLTGNRVLADNLNARPITGTTWQVQADMDDDGLIHDDQVRVVSPDGEILITERLVRINSMRIWLTDVIERHLTGQAQEEPYIEPIAVRAEPPVKVVVAPEPTIATNPIQPAAEIIHEIPIAEIGHFPGGNIRERFAGLDELAETIRAHGVVQPLTVNEINGRHVLIAGERRLRAAGLANLATVPCRVMHLPEQDALEWMLIENIHREDITPMEEARAYKRLMASGANQGDVAKRVGKSREHVNEHLQLLELPAELQGQVATGSLSVRAGVEVIRRTRTYPDVVMEHVAKAVSEAAPTAREVAQVIDRALEETHVVRTTPPKAEPPPQAPKPQPERLPRLQKLCTEAADLLNRMLLDKAVRSSWGPDVIQLLERLEAGLGVKGRRVG